MPARYINGNIEFDVPHFSNYVIAYDESKAAECAKDSSCPISVFTDASPSAWYHDGVHYVLENKLMYGTTATTFEPNAGATRAEIAVMLTRLIDELAK